MANREFTEAEVIRRTARSLGKRDAEVAAAIDAYAHEWLRLARETQYSPVIPRMEKVS